MYTKAHSEIHFIYIAPQNSIIICTLQTSNVTAIQCCRLSILQQLRTFNVADIQCCHQMFGVATVSVQCSTRSLPVRLNSHIQITCMFMHIVVIFILLPQMFC